MPLASGTRLGPYEILTVIGAGGMGEVYKARDTRLDRTVAIKISSPQFIERFQREARAIAALSHPHICALHDIGPDYLVMEYIEGTPLKGPLAAGQALSLALQIAAALEEAHAKGVTHRDLKPANILVTAAGVKLLDFGLAKREPALSLSDTTATQTQAGTVLGTAAYMSPEQASGKPADGRSDIFSFGAVLYELLSGQRAFPGETQITTMAAVLHQEPRPIETAPGLAAIVHRCLRKAPAERYQTAGELTAALTAVRVDEPAAASIAVLPFANMSADKENEYFSDGLAEEIINALTQVPGLKVTARTSAFSFRGKEVKIAEIARELGVAHVLEGSVRKAGNRIRVTAQLIKAADGFHMWSERYDRELNDVFAIQDEISAAIVKQLQVNLTGRRALPHAPRPTNLAAYEAVLEGRHNWLRWTPAGLSKAVSCFDRAAALDPGYAPAQAGIAEYHVTLATIGLAESKKALTQASAAARRALELDPNAAEATAALGLSSGFLNYDWAACGALFARALEQNPAAGSVRFRYAYWYLGAQGKLEQALTEMDRLLEDDPLSPAYRFGKAHVLSLLGESARARDWCQRALDIEPNYFMALFQMSGLLAAEGRFDKALAVAEQAIESHGIWGASVANLGALQGVAGQTTKARQSMAELEELARTTYVPAIHRVVIYAGMGEMNSALDWLEKAIDQREPPAVLTSVLPNFAAIRQDPRYQVLQRKMNLG